METGGCWKTQRHPCGERINLIDRRCHVRIYVCCGASASELNGEPFQTLPELSTIELEDLSPTAIRPQLSRLPAPNGLNLIIEKA
ncbi:protein of unknown function [Ralstonia solanacearum CFBP2957]|nr:protein of unknown function [Ralstonia solanacearum CFBP2957]